MGTKRQNLAGQQRHLEKDRKGPARAGRPETPSDVTWASLTQITRLLARKAAGEFFEEAHSDAADKSTRKSDEVPSSARGSTLRPDRSGGRS